LWASAYLTIVNIPAEEWCAAVLSERTLTPAELDVLLWICRGYVSDKDLGRVLERSPHTVRTHVASIFKKLKVTSRAELVSWLKRAGRGHTTPRGDPTSR